MKKVIGLFIVIALLLTLAGCNYSSMETHYDFDYAIVKFPDGNTEKIEIKKWSDYEGEQLQIKTEDGTVYLVSSFNCVLVSEGK